MGKIIESNKLVVELYELNIPVTRPWDANAYCPSVQWLKDFGEWLKENKRPYVDVKYKCKHFALWGILQAADSIIQRRDIQDAMPAIFYCSVHINNVLLGIQGPVQHANCLVRCDDYNWYFLEPQTGLYEKINLSDYNYNTPDWCWV